MGVATAFSSALIFFTLIQFTYCASLPQALRPASGPFDIIIRNIETCPKKLQGQNGLRVVNFHAFYNKDRPSEITLSGDVTLDFPIDNDHIMGHFQVSQWTKRGGWKPGINDVRLPQLCLALTTYPYLKSVYEPLSTHVYGHKVGCPIPPIKNGKIRNYTLRTRLDNTQHFFYGRWRCDFIFFNMSDKWKSVKSCMRAIADTVPKKSEESTRK